MSFCESFCVLGYVMCFCVFKNDGEIDLDLGFFFPHISTFQIAHLFIHTWGTSDSGWACND